MILLDNFIKHYPAGSGEEAFDDFLKHIDGIGGGGKLGMFMEMVGECFLLLAIPSVLGIILIAYLFIKKGDKWGRFEKWFYGVPFVLFLFVFLLALVGRLFFV